jgi:hypothetical protein
LYLKQRHRGAETQRNVGELVFGIRSLCICADFFWNGVLAIAFDLSVGEAWVYGNAKSSAYYAHYARQCIKA